eukprot:229103_1
MSGIPMKEFDNRTSDADRKSIDLAYTSFQDEISPSHAKNADANVSEPPSSDPTSSGASPHISRWFACFCPCLARRKRARWERNQEWLSLNRRHADQRRSDEARLRAKASELEAVLASEEENMKNTRGDPRVFGYPIILAVRRLDQAGVDLATLNAMDFLETELNYVEAQHNLDSLASGGIVDTAARHVLPVGWKEMRLKGSNKRVYIGPNGEETLCPPGDHLWVLLATNNNTFD